MDLMRGLRKHPHTGAVLQPIGWRRNGSAIWPVMGASPDDSSNDGTSGDGEPGSGGGEGAGGEGKQGSEGNDGGEGKDGEKPVSRADFERLERHLAEADRKRTAAEEALKKIEDAKKDDLTKAQERVQELEKANEANAAEVAKLRLDNAFLTVNDITWHSKKQALKLAESEGYLEGVVKDGKVDEKVLASKLKEFAKANAHLVKAESGQQSPPPSGGAVGSGGKGGKNGSTDEATLKQRYRVLDR